VRIGKESRSKAAAQQRRNSGETAAKQRRNSEARAGNHGAMAG
jgi:hypothetical protein